MAGVDRSLLSPGVSSHLLWGRCCDQSSQNTTAAAQGLQDIIGEAFPVATALRPSGDGFLEGTGQALSITR